MNKLIIFMGRSERWDVLLYLASLDFNHMFQKWAFKNIACSFYPRFLSYGYDLFIFWNIILVFHSISLSSLIEIPRWNACPMWLKIICLSLKLLEVCWRAPCRETLEMALIWGQLCQSSWAGQGEKLPQIVCSSYLVLLEPTSAVVLFQCS